MLPQIGVVDAGRVEPVDELATVVAVDHRYRHHVKPEDAAEIVGGLDG